MGGGFDGFVAGAGGVGQVRESADGLQADAFLNEFGRFLRNEMLDSFINAATWFGGATSSRSKGVNGKNSLPTRRSLRRSCGARPRLFVAFDTAARVLSSSVRCHHDDGDVPRSSSHQWALVAAWVMVLTAIV
jgi:hypothetical protein